MPQTIFFTGATGYLGGSVLSLLLEHKNRTDFDITALVRSEEKAEKLGKATGINIVVASHKDLDLVEDLASKADVIFSLADSDDLNLAKAQLKGCKLRYTATGTLPIFIHTSGTGLLVDDSFGMYGPKDVIDDIETTKIENIPSTAFHRNVDLELVQADQEGYVKTYIVVPGAIYGVATGKVADSGAQNTRNLVIPRLFSFAFERGEAPLIGEGKNEWPHVEVGEVSDLIILLYNSAAERPATGHGREGYYFAENGGTRLYDWGQVAQQVLIKTGRTKTDSKVPTTLSQEESSRYLPPFLLRVIGGNAMCKSSRSRSLGWNPVKSENEFLESLRVDLEFMASKLP
ncbi:hypothetical protein C8J56DRAFT_915114 [Mycena floridula]|nr:hypothetical protein C8J56DRAFT_915114 [Mycena floridula]